MKLLISKNKTFLELEDDVYMKANDFGLWFWDDFFNIDAKKIDNPNINNYSEIYEDFKQPIFNERIQRSLF